MGSIADKSIADKLVSRSLVLARLLSLWYLTGPASPEDRSSPDESIPEQKVKEAVRVLQQRQTAAVPALDEAKPRSLSAGGFATLVVEAEARPAMTAQWPRAHSGDRRANARWAVHKNRLQGRLGFGPYSCLEGKNGWEQFY
jgi:hypothetical protein